MSRNALAFSTARLLREVVVEQLAPVLRIRPPEQPEAVSRFTPGHIPYAHQQNFYDSEARHTLIGGAAGPGKTVALIERLRELAFKQPGCRMYLFRESYRQLLDTDISEFLERVSEDEFTYNSSQHTARFVNGSILNFRHCPNLSVARTYKSTQMDVLAFDELTELPFDAWWYLTSRARSTGHWPSRILAATNPGGQSHYQVKMLWVDREDDGSPTQEAQDFARDSKIKWDLQRDFKFTPALVTDNPALLERDPDYLTNLESMDDDESRALRWGDWSVFRGQAFHFLNAVHVRRACEVEINPEWPRFAAMDFGETAENCYGEAAADFDVAGPRPRVYVYLQISREKRALAENVEEIVTETKGRRYRRRVADPSMWGLRSDGRDRISSADQACKLGLSFDKGHNNREDGARLVREYLRVREDGLPGIIFLDNCTGLIRNLPGLLYDPKNPRDIWQKPGVKDHSYDMLRYLLCAIEGLDAAEPMTAARVVRR